MRDFATLADLQAADQSTDVPVGTIGAYTGVQYVDLERSDPNLVGFSGGFSVRSSEPMVEKPLDSPEKRSEWWEQCHYVPLADGEAASSSSSRVAHVTRKEFFADRYCSDEPVVEEKNKESNGGSGKTESLYVVMRECLEYRIGVDGAAGFFPYEEPYCYTNFRIPLDSARLPGCDRGTNKDCHFMNEPYTFLKTNDQNELDKIELEHRETCSDLHDEIGLEHFSTSETGIALNEATPGLVEITRQGDDYEATFPRVLL